MLKDSTPCAHLDSTIAIFMATAEPTTLDEIFEHIGLLEQ